MSTNVMAEKSIQSTRTAFDIVETIADLDRPTISEIAEAVDHSRSTVYYHLKILQQERYVVPGEEGYRLGIADGPLRNAEPPVPPAQRRGQEARRRPGDGDG